MYKGLSICVVRPQVLLLALLISASGVAQGTNDLKVGERFEVVGQLYAYEVADDLNNRVASIVSLVPLNLSGPEIVSRQLVPSGTVMTIVDRAPKCFLFFLCRDEYAVRLEGMSLPKGVPVVFSLSRGIEGKVTPLNPMIFKPVP